MLPVILKYSGVLIAIATIVIVGTQIYNARLWIDCYPERIQKAVPLQTKKEKKLKLILGWPFLLALILMPILAAIETMKLQEYSSFFSIFLVTFCVGFFFNIYDLLILDWLIFCFITPKYQILKGSEHLIHEYKNYKFHVIASTKGILWGVLYSGILTLILYLIL